MTLATLIFTILVWVFAGRFNRDQIIWLLGCLILTPFIALILLFMFHLLDPK